MILLIPCCGESERFGGAKKQFILHPSGDLPLPLFSASGITGYDKRYFIFLEKDFYESGHYVYYNRSEVILLSNQTKNQVETIQSALHHIIGNGIVGKQQIFIKDCDNYFDCYVKGNSIAIKNGPFSEMELMNKSYSLIDNFGYLRWTLERSCYTNYMNVGGYGFNSAYDFLVYSNKKQYITEVITAALNDGEIFTMCEIKNYVDYGTIDTWNDYLKTLKPINNLSQKREEFEAAEWVTNTVDLMDENPLADPNCKTCKGHGVIDAGYFTGCILENCPDCWRK